MNLTKIDLRALAVVMIALASMWSGSAAPAQETRPAPASIVDLNSAKAEELERLPGISPATAKKIIGLRPFESLDELRALGLDDAQIATLQPHVKLQRPARPPRRVRELDANAARPGEQAKETPAVKIDLNSATAPELESLPGVGPTIAKKIIAARPLRTIDELKLLGLTDAQIEKLAPFAGVKRLMAPPPRDVVKDPPLGGKDAPIGGKDPPAVPELDLNAATVTELQTNAGLTDAEAKQVVAHRPYAAGADLARAGLPSATIARMKALATIEAPARTPPAAGLVWVNTDSRIYHPPGARWYGKTLNGQWMTEAEAAHQGYRSLK